MDSQAVPAVLTAAGLVGVYFALPDAGRGRTPAARWIGVGLAVAALCPFVLLLSHNATWHPASQTLSSIPSAALFWSLSAGGLAGVVGVVASPKLDHGVRWFTVLTLCVAGLLATRGAPTIMVVLTVVIFGIGAAAVRAGIFDRATGRENPAEDSHLREPLLACAAAGVLLASSLAAIESTLTAEPTGDANRIKGVVERRREEATVLNPAVLDYRLLRPSMAVSLLIVAVGVFGFLARADAKTTCLALGGAAQASLFAAAALTAFHGSTPGGRMLLSTGVIVVGAAWWSVVASPTFLIADDPEDRL